LDQQVENLTFAVDSPPEPEPLARDRHDHLVHVPATGRTRSSTPTLAREQRPELDDPATDRLVGDAEAAFSQEVLVAVAQREPKIQPDGTLYDQGRSRWRA
jgi:hypothetical protein